MDCGVEGSDAVGECHGHDEAGGAVEDNGPDHCPWKHARRIADFFGLSRFVSIVDEAKGCGMELTHVYGGI